MKYTYGLHIAVIPVEESSIDGTRPMIVSTKFQSLTRIVRPQELCDSPEGALCQAIDEIQAQIKDRLALDQLKDQES